MTEDTSMSWQKAVAELTAERSRAESAARLIKRLGSERDIAIAELNYGNGKAEADAVISAFDIALEAGKGLDDLADLEARLKRATEAREALGNQAMALVNSQEGREKGISDLVTFLLPELLTALTTVWSRWREGEKTLRGTIAARLQEARWPDFASIGKP